MGPPRSGEGKEHEKMGQKGEGLEGRRRSFGVEESKSKDVKELE